MGFGQNIIGETKMVGVENTTQTQTPREKDVRQIYVDVFDVNDLLDVEDDVARLCGSEEFIEDAGYSYLTVDEESVVRNALVERRVIDEDETISFDDVSFYAEKHDETRTVKIFAGVFDVFNVELYNIYFDDEKLYNEFIEFLDKLGC